jgi:hypothetical protein
MFKHDCHAAILGDPGDGGRDQGDITLSENMQRAMAKEAARLRPEKAGVLIPWTMGACWLNRGQCDVLTCTDQVLLQSVRHKQVCAHGTSRCRRDDEPELHKFNGSKVGVTTSLHDQAWWHGHGTGDLPFDHRGTRGTALRLRE